MNVVPTGCMESYAVMSYFYYTSVFQSVASGIPATCPEDLWEETEVSRTVWYMKTPDLDETDSSSKSQSDVLQLSETVSESVRIFIVYLYRKYSFTYCSDSKIPSSFLSFFFLFVFLLFSLLSHILLPLVSLE